MSRACGAAFVLALVAGSTTVAGGQQIHGRFAASASDAPLAGAYVSLLDASGAALAAGLTGATGHFVLVAPGPGRYTVRAEHIGYATASAVLEMTSSGAPFVELHAAFRAIELEGLTAEADRACDVPAATGRRVVELWDEVRKAFRVTALVEGEGLYLFDVERWTRTLEPHRLRVMEETRRPRTGMHRGSPFVSLPPERLAAEGYVQPEPRTDDLRYYAPDARVLLDRSFQETHCFGFTDTGPEDGWVGLRFEPRDLRAPDIEGTLWIDGETYAPRRLDYRYPVLPWELDTDRVGGRIDFTRLPEGPWIVERWWIRMPVVHEEQLRFGGRSQARYTVASLLEEGGVVRDVRAGGAAAFSRARARVEGAVLDSTSNAPLADVRVRLTGTAFETRTAPDGSFHFEDVPEGRYEARASTPALNVLGAVPKGVDLDAHAGETARVVLRLPSLTLAASARCDRPLTEDGDGVVIGSALDADGRPVAGTSVEISWETVLALRSRSGGRDRSGALVDRVTDVDQHTTVATVPASDDGTFTVCGLPGKEEMRLVATAPGFRSETTTVRLAPFEVPRLEMTLAPAALSEAVVVRVLGSDGRPLEGAVVGLEILARNAVTDASGRAVFERVPAGRAIVTVEHLGFVTRADTLDIAPGDPSAVTVTMADEAIDLEPITVAVETPEARARRMSGSSASKALSAIDIRDAIENGRANNLAEVIHDALPNGVRLSPIVRGSNYVGTCIESTRGGYVGRKTPGICQMVQVVIDGGFLTTDEAARFVESFPLSEIVSLELLSPMEQTFRFGTMDATGMLIVRTTRGR